MAKPKPDWNIVAVRARQAQKLLPRIQGRIDWREIEVAHIDTGITPHPTFGPWHEGASDFVHVGDGLNLVNEGDQPFDPLSEKDRNPGHGTRTASILCGRPVPEHKFPGGVAPGLPVIPYRAIGSVVPFKKKAQARIARAMEHAIDLHCEVISMSLGSPMVTMHSPSRLGQAVDRAYELGIIVVAAGGQGTEMVTYPGKFSRTIGVGGTRPNGKVYHKYALRTTRWIDVWAPAYNVFRASSMLSNGDTVPASYRYGEGTSYATAHVAAAAAMWLACHGDALDAEYPENWQRVEAFRRLIGDTSGPMSGSYWPTRPVGILNIEQLLMAELPKAGTLSKEQRLAELEWM